ncbi:FAD-dependent oxidoreductase [Orrella sp. JC864]|uniref:FAD-dependent oxidoreductase n=1 Tax=Orrella sp. JC864 TaxID=3120298 RepID=UPI00142C68AF
MGDERKQAHKRYAYRPHPDARAHEPARHRVVVVGAGPVGLTAALDLARRGVPVVLLDEDDKLSAGSRAICFAKRTLEIWDRLGVGRRMVEKGVSWQVGRVFLGADEVWRFDLLPEPGHGRPAFINLQQYHAEEFLVEAALREPLLDLRWQSKVTALSPQADGARLRVATPEGEYDLHADWVLACDGSRSPLRAMLGQQPQGRIFRDRFLIADIRMQAPFPPERWFWFDPPFHPGQSVLLHRQPDDTWRVDFQLGWDADPKEAVKPENVRPLLHALLGDAARFELVWTSVYTFACERMARFRHGRVIFAGDAAHRVSPFGARGANSGVQDADNLAWKLQRVLQGWAGESLLDSYAHEREAAADENILHSSRATDFISPKSEISLLFRNTVLKLARHHDFARSLVNSGRLSTPAVYRDSPLNTPDQHAYAGCAEPGACAPDAPVQVRGQPGWWLQQLDGRFVLAVFCMGQAPLPGDTRDWLRALDADPRGARVVLVRPAGAPPCDTALATVVDIEGRLAERYDMAQGGAYLIRPDQHVAARWRALDARAVAAALARAACATEEPAWTH